MAALRGKANEKISYSLLTVLTIAIVIPLCLISILFWSDPSLQRAHIKWTYDKAALEGALLGLGIPPRKQATGIGHFTLKNLPGIRFHVPREHLDMMPRQPNGEIFRLGLTFYLPDMTSTQALQKQGNYKARYPFRVMVFMYPLASYSRYPEDEHLEHAFLFFQKKIKFFQRKAQVSKGPRQVWSLKNGKYIPKLNLIMYQGIDKDEIDFNKIYLPPNANPSNPGEWIYCESYGCHQYWFRDGIEIETLFSRYLLLMHAEIRKKVDQKIDEYMEKTVAP